MSRARQDSGGLRRRGSGEKWYYEYSQSMAMRSPMTIHYSTTYAHPLPEHAVSRAGSPAHFRSLPSQFYGLSIRFLGTSRRLTLQHSPRYLAPCYRPVQFVGSGLDGECGEERLVGIACANIGNTIVLCSDVRGAQVDLD